MKLVTGSVLGVDLLQKELLQQRQQGREHGTSAHERERLHGTFQAGTYPILVWTLWGLLSCVVPLKLSQKCHLRHPILTLCKRLPRIMIKPSALLREGLYLAAAQLQHGQVQARCSFQ
jgi:hypothetical protein